MIVFPSPPQRGHTYTLTETFPDYGQTRTARVGKVGSTRRWSGAYWRKITDNWVIVDGERVEHEVMR